MKIFSLIYGVEKFFLLNKMGKIIAIQRNLSSSYGIIQEVIKLAGNINSGCSLESNLVSSHISFFF